MFTMLQFQKTDKTRYIRKIILLGGHRKLQIFLLDRRNEQTGFLKFFQIHLLDSGGTARR